MRLPRIRIATCTCLLALACVPSGSAAAQSAVTCGDTITQPGTYELSGDCSGSGITIAASDVTLRLMRHTMTGTGATDNWGIDAQNRSNLTIEGPGTLEGFYAGVHLDSVADSEVSNLVVTDSTWQGLTAHTTTNVTFERVTSKDNEFHGFTQDGANGNRYLHVVGKNNGSNGLYLYGSTNVYVGNSSFSGNGQYGVHIGNSSSNNRIVSNKMTGNFTGLFVEDASTGNTLRGNNARNNISFDLYDENAGCDSNTWEHNRGSHNQSCIH
jgi:parallel beta-helix repeat protein